jgi:HAD superfamily phosphoserine phosphatase-like hydrolase
MLRPVTETRMLPGDVVAADLEGTITDGETWRGLGRWLAANGGRRAYRRFLAPRLAAMPLVRAGLIPRQAFRDRWIRDLVALLAGRSAGEIDEIAAWVVDEELWPGRREPILDELAEARAGGARVVVVSGTYEPVLRLFVERIGVEGVGTPLELAGDVFTGRLAGPVNTGARKVERLARLIGTATVARAYGDSIADAPLLRAAAEAVAVTPDAALARLARSERWRIMDAAAAGAVTKRPVRPS